MKAVPCIPAAAAVSLGVHDEQPTLCWSGKCIELRVGEDVATFIDTSTRPPASMHPVSVRDDGRSISACVDDVCTPFGPKLAAAVRDTKSVPEVTSDRKAAVVGLDAWSIDRDHVLGLKPPAAIFGADAAKRAQILVDGKWLVVTWVSSDCRDPKNWPDPHCGRHGQLVDSSGANRGEDLGWFDPGLAGQLDDRLAFVTDQFVPGLMLFDLETGKQHWVAHPLISSGKVIDAVRVRPNLLELLYRGGLVGYRLMTIIGSAEYPIEITDVRYLPFCQSGP